MALLERRQNPNHAEQGRERVGGWNADSDGRILWTTGRQHNAAQRLDYVVHGFATGVLLAKAADRAINDARVGGSGGGVADAKALCRTSRKVFDDDVCLAYQVSKNRLRLGMLEVEGDALFATQTDDVGDRHIVRVLAAQADSVSTHE